jgi:hypothetical protein
MPMSRRLIPLAAILVALAVAIVAWGPLATSGAEDGVINLTATVNGSNCGACHAQIGNTDVPGLIFSHGAHLLVACDACHLRAPHEAGNTYRPVMDTCFVCHGLIHGPEGLLASGECSDCHTPAFTLRPPSHVPTWAEKPHADTGAKGGVNRCLMCHEPVADCDVCHLEKGLDIAPMPKIYQRTIPIEPDRPDVLVDTDAPPSMGACVFCHPSIESEGGPVLIFAHDYHLRRDYKCEDCHEAFPHGNDTTARPDMLSCYRCHSLKHAQQADFASEECEACHPPAFELMPFDHTTAFRVGTHDEPATQDLKPCTMCHASSFCVPCHVGGVKMVNDQVSPIVFPEDHTKPEWQEQHGANYLGQKGACSICHAPDYCSRCHVTPMPHQTQWLARHAAGNGYPKEDCYVCHTDRADCQECHHATVAGLELIRENCVECHEEMKLEPATDIKDIAMAEHAVHFGVAESSVGRPYVCDDCHIGFTSMQIQSPASSTQAHDLRLCYDCHGNLDINRLQIAPYPGSELCRRCHEDLRL